MTILYAIRRPAFAVLGADQLYTGLAWAGDARAAFSGLHKKVHIHPQRALAFGTAGVAILGGRPTDEIVGEVIDGGINVPLLQLGFPLQVILGMQVALQTDAAGCTINKDLERLECGRLGAGETKTLTIIGSPKDAGNFDFEVGIVDEEQGDLLYPDRDVLGWSEAVTP